jgi:hypothetical protein
MTNLLVALIYIIESPAQSLDFGEIYKHSNRANAQGDALETYIKDIFCNSFGVSKAEKDNIYSQYFSYIGNSNNPPDIIIKEGDAIEIKKIENISSSIALNSSYPKNKLYASDSRITNACKNCENNIWLQKDIIYIVGTIPKGGSRLKSLWFVYGDCYAASRDVYQRISDKISEGINDITDVELMETNEIAKVKKVDPLGITDLRIRGMWHIENPIKVFSNIAKINADNEFNFNAVILQNKYLSFPQEDRNKLEGLQNSNFIIVDVKIKSPDNPAHMLNAKLLSYAK